MDAKERAELWERLLQHDELELELSRQKEGMEQVFIKKHQKVIISPLPFSSPFTTFLSPLLLHLTPENYSCWKRMQSGRPRYHNRNHNT